MLQNAVFCDDILKKPSASGGVAPTPLPGALPLDPTGGLLRPPDPRIIFLLFHFSPVPCLNLGSSALEADTLTTRPMRQSVTVEHGCGRHDGGLVKVSTTGAVGQEFVPQLSHSSDVKRWHSSGYSAKCWMLFLELVLYMAGQRIACLICNFYLSVAARAVVWADPSLRYTSMLLGR